MITPQTHERSKGRRTGWKDWGNKRLIDGYIARTLLGGANFDFWIDGLTTVCSFSVCVCVGGDGACRSYWEQSKPFLFIRIDGIIISQLCLAMEVRL